VEADCVGTGSLDPIGLEQKQFRFGVIMRKVAVCFLQWLILGSLGLCNHLAWGQNYGDELNTEWQSILGIKKQDGPYQWFGYPVDNFGVLTVYGPPSGKHLTDSDRLCATWTCIGVDASKIPADVVLYTTVNGYASSGQGPSIHLTNDKKSKGAVTLLLSNFFSALTLTGSANLSKDAAFDLTADGAYKRSVNVQKFQDYISSLADKELLKQIWNSGQFVYIGSDIVAHNLKITLTLNTQKDAGINAKLTQAMANVGGGSTAGATVSSSGTGKYIVEYPGFVVLATQLHHEWKPGALFAGGADIEDKKREFLASTSTVPTPKVDPNAHHS
jgi:hypothetical protein